MRGLLILCALVVASCETTPPEDLPPLSEFVMRGLEHYEQRSGAGNFYVSIDGQMFGYDYCPSGTQSFDCRVRPGLGRRACERNSNGVPCILLAQGGRIPAGLRRAESVKTNEPIPNVTTK